VERVGRGGVTVAPLGVPHAFRVLSDKARLLCLQTPGSGEPFYRSASEPATADTEGPVDFARVQESAKQSGAVEILGPPPSSRRSEQPRVISIRPLRDGTSSALHRATAVASGLVHW